MIPWIHALGMSLIWLSGASASLAAPLRLAQMDHASWTGRDGAPVDVYAFGQDNDGSLWILSGSGLYNFDGFKFSPFSPQSPKATVSLAGFKSLFVDADGCLWLGSGIRGVAQVCDRQISRVFDESDGLIDGEVRQILQAPNGDMLAIAKNHLLRLRHGRWLDEGASAPFSEGSVMSAFFDREGRLFVMANAAIWLQSPDSESRFRKLSTEGGRWGNFSERPDGSVWTITNAPGRKPAYLERVSFDSADLARSQRIVTDASGFISDHQGILWIAGDKGVERADLSSRPAESPAIGPANDPPLDVFLHIDGLTADGVNVVFQDRSRNIWIGTTGGIDRFRDTPLVHFIDRAFPWNPQVTVCPSGEVWVAAFHAAPFSLRNGVATDHGPPRDSGAIYCDRAGAIWLTDQQKGLVNYQDGKTKIIPAPPGIAAELMRKVEGRNEHSLFVAITRHGLWTLKDAAWAQFTTPGFPEITPISLYEDSEDRLWAGFIDSRIAMLKDGKGRTYGSGLESPLGEVQAFLESRRGMLAAGTNGLAIFRNDHFESLLLEDSNNARGISGLLEAANGDLWLNGLHGIVRVPAEELSKADQLPAYRMRSELLKEAGMAGPATQMVGLPSAAADSDGRFWFSTATSLFSLDPLSAIKNPELPKLGRLSLSVDAKEAASGVKLPHGEHTIRIGYLGVYMAAPERVTYKYKLEGLDTDWQDAGSRTEAVYTSIRPGDYRFKVAASNRYGQWTPEADSIRFSILPAFYQTVWFYVLCMLAGFLIFWGIVRLRTRRLAREIGRRAEERADERIRIARDLHDTLLQGVQGLMLRFHAAAQEVSVEGPARRNLNDALQAADQVLVEARDRVSRLRADRPPSMDLAARYRTVGEDLNYENRVRFTVTTEGHLVPLSPRMLDEMYFIGREALTNAFRHADASVISVTIKFAWSDVTFVFADDGCGFHPSEPGSGERIGHWGMSGMMERAHRIGAKFECRSAPGSGTSILISVPMRSTLLHALTGLLRR
jgi:signal transduction histidine kinase/ligand-binding sensor domain-containing protein